MMDWTDRHCRRLHRTLTRRARLYTEMLTADAVIHGDRARLLAFDPAEHPVALQLGGSEPAKLAEAARIGEELGYDEINLNVGCPSDRVQSGRFGACLMREPALVAECMAAIRAAVAIPATVKCRLGVDEQDPDEALFALVDACAAAGVTVFVVHARKAWLKGLSPKENREIPPLDYPLVWRLKRERPDLTIVINGGIASAGRGRGAPGARRRRHAGPRRLPRARRARRSGPAAVRRSADVTPRDRRRALPALRPRRAGARHASRRHDPAHAGPLPWRAPAHAPGAASLRSRARSRAPASR